MAYLAWFESLCGRFRAICGCLANFSVRSKKVKISQLGDWRLIGQITAQSERVNLAAVSVDLIPVFNRNLAPQSTRLLAQHFCGTTDELKPPSWHRPLIGRHGRNALFEAAGTGVDQGLKKAQKAIKKAVKNPPHAAAVPQRPITALKPAN